MGEADPGSQRDVWERPTLHVVFKHLCGLLPVEDVDWGVLLQWLQWLQFESV